MQPTLYVGSLDTFAKWIAVKEIIDNARDEAINGHATFVRVTRYGDEMFSVQDNGRGIPIGTHAKTGKPAIQLVFCELHAGGKMHNSEKSAYQKSIGVHGMGAAITNALSVNLKAFVFHRNWKVFECKRGEPVNKDVRAATAREIPLDCENIKRGTFVEFTLDNSIFNSPPIDDSMIHNYLQILSDFFPGIRFEYVVCDDAVSDDNPVVTVYKNTKSLVELTAEDNNVNSKDVLHVRTPQLECALCFSHLTPISKNLYVCGSPTPDGGTHWQGLVKAVASAVEPHVKKEKFNAEDFAACLSGVMSIDVSAPKFRGQTKQKLESREAVKIVADALTAPLTAFFKKHKAQVANAIASAERLYALHEQYKHDTDLSKALAAPKGKSNLPAKLVPCLHAKPHERELFILEGDSAISASKASRDKKFQELLPIRGKILNVVNNARSAIDNEIVKDLLAAIGYTKDDPDFEKSRVGKIIIATDADSDGCHIQILLIGLLYTYVPAAFRKGMVHVVNLPLYVRKNGKEMVFGNTLKEVGASEKGALGKHGKDGVIVRMKGLGELNPAEMKILVYDKTRDLVKLSPLRKEEMHDFRALLSSNPEMRKRMLDYDPAQDNSHEDHPATRRPNESRAVRIRKRMTARLRGL
jgi:DNA gyrase/topoisomerase IV subunit B